jgi:hypothetical protein
MKERRDNMAEVSCARSVRAVARVSAVLLVMASTALAGQVSVGPTYDVEGSSTSGSNFVLTDGQWDIFTQQLPQYGIYRRGVMEFNLSSVPAGQQITSASLRLYVNVMTSDSTPSYPRLTMYGFAGDGVSQVADATKTSTVIGQSPLITSLGTININLDAAYLSGLRGTSGYVGLVMFDPTSGHQAGFYAKEGSAIGPVTPLLTLNYTPEPVSLAILGLGCGLLVSRRRR